MTPTAKWTAPTQAVTLILMRAIRPRTIKTSTTRPRPRHPRLNARMVRTTTETARQIWLTRDVRALRITTRPTLRGAGIIMKAAVLLISALPGEGVVEVGEAVREGLGYRRGRSFSLVPGQVPARLLQAPV